MARRAGELGDEDVSILPVEVEGTRRVAAWRRVDSAVLAAYLVLAGTKLALHPMWRDELQSWELSATSPDVSTLLSRVRYEQHPPGWYLLLWGWSRLSGDPRMLQVLAFAIVALTTAFVLRCCPWPRPLRWLLLAGYYPVFEWSTLARPYLLVFALAIIGAELVRRRRGGLALGAVLAGLILVDDAYGTVIAVALLAASMAAGPGPSTARWRRAGRSPLALTVAALVLAALSDRRPPHYGGPVLRLTATNVGDALAAPAHALVPLPWPEAGFWSTWVIDAAGLVVVALLGVALVVVIARVLRRERAALVLWVLGVIGTVGVQCVTDLPYARFVGSIVVALVCAFWVHPDVGWSPRTPVAAALAVLLGLQVPGGLIALTETAAHPFSQAEAAGRAVRSLPGTVIAVADSEAVPVAAYAGRPLAGVDGQRPASYVTWDQARLCGGRGCNEVQLLEEALSEAQSMAQAAPVYLVTDFEVPPGTVDLVPLRAWTGAVVVQEDYWLYRYEP